MEQIYQQDISLTGAFLELNYQEVSFQQNEMFTQVIKRARFPQRKTF